MKYTKEQISAAREAVDTFAKDTMKEELEGTPKSIEEQAEAFSNIVVELITKIKEI